MLAEFASPAGGSGGGGHANKTPRRLNSFPSAALDFRLRAARPGLDGDSRVQSKLAPTIASAELGRRLARRKSIVLPVCRPRRPSPARAPCLGGALATIVRRPLVCSPARPGPASALRKHARLGRGVAQISTASLVLKRAPEAAAAAPRKSCDSCERASERASSRLARKKRAPWRGQAGGAAEWGARERGARKDRGGGGGTRA